ISQHIERRGRLACRAACIRSGSNHISGTLSGLERSDKKLGALRDYCLATKSTREKFSQILHLSYSRLCEVAVTVASSTQFLLKITCNFDPRLTSGPIS